MPSLCGLIHMEQPGAVSLQQGILCTLWNLLCFRIVIQCFTCLAASKVCLQAPRGKDLQTNPYEQILHFNVGLLQSPKAPSPSSVFFPDAASTHIRHRIPFVVNAIRLQYISPSAKNAASAGSMTLSNADSNHGIAIQKLSNSSKSRRKKFPFGLYERRQKRPIII